MLLSPTRHLCHKAILTSFGDIAQIYLIYRQNEEAKKYAPNERTRKIPRKRINEMETTKISDAEFKTMVIRVLKYFRERVDNLHEKFKRK